MRTPETRPLQNRYRIARASKTEFPFFNDPRTKAIEDQSWNRDFILTGSETLSYADVASKLGGIPGRTIRHVNLDVDQLVERYRAGGLDKEYAQTLASMDKWIEDGNEDRVTDGVLVLIQQAPNSADVFIRENSRRWVD